MGIAERRALKGMGAVNDIYAEAAAVRPEKQKSGKIKPVGDGRAWDNKVLAFLYDIFLEKRTVCKIKSPVCIRQATVVHHKAGRGKYVLFDWTTWLECCPACNGYVESHDAWAVKNGFKISKHTKQ